MSTKVVSDIKNYLSIARFNKPIGTFLLLWPTWIGLWFAANGTPNIKILVIFSFGVIIMRACGCIINDIADYKIDSRVKRTKNRPLANGSLRRKHAWLLFFVFCLAAFILVLQLNPFTVKLSFIAIVLACLYPLCKRFTNYPQVILGFAFGFGIPMAYSSTLNSITIESIFLYLGTVLWIIAFDTQYALVDQDDDNKIGVKSTAFAFGDFAREIIFILQICYLVILFLIGMSKGLNFIFFTSLFIGFYLFCKQYISTKNLERENCFKAFLNNNLACFVIYLGVLLSLLKY